MHGFWALAVVLLVVAGSLGLLALVAPGSQALAKPAAPTTPGKLGTAAMPPTHGDLVVGPGQVFTIQPTLGGPTYYQGGNITVEGGGTLVVRNVVLSFAEFVGDTGTAQQRLSHIYFFHDAGTVNFYNASLTTDVQIINAYAKLNFTVTGALNAWNSTFDFPGWLYVSGAGADVTLNNTVVTSNPDVPLLSGGEPSAIFGDTLWAPTVTVLGGAKLTLLASHIENAYADNTIVNGYARPTPLNLTDKAGLVVGPGGTTSFPVHGPSDSANLSLDWAYPAAGALSGFVTVSYTGSILGNTSVDVSVLYGGVEYAISTITLPSNSSGTFVRPFSAALVGVITAGGMLSYLNNTGDFGVPNTIALTIHNTAGPATNLTALGFQLNTTGPTYDDSVTGAGSVLSAIDSVLGFNWNLYNAAPGAAYSQAPPVPWISNKLLFTDGAVGYLANITTPDALPGVFSASALLPDSSSQVYLYRWAEFNLTGRNPVLPIQGASLSAFYAYDSNQANNNTATVLNNIATADPALWGYIQYWDTFHGVSSYGRSNAAGEAFLLLASGNLTRATLPDGVFLGGYHIGVAVPAVGVMDHWFNWSVSPYPTGVAAKSLGYNGPDFAPLQRFQDYFGAMTVASVTILANGVANNTVEIGQTLGVKVTVTDAGTATLTQVGADLFYNWTQGHLATYEAVNLDLTAPGQQANFTFFWVVNDTVTGLHGWFNHTLTVALVWNYGIPSLAGGSLVENTSLQFAPSEIAITAFTLPPTTLDLSQQYFSNGTIAYNGTQPATIELWAIPVNGGNPIQIGVTTSMPGNFQNLPWFNLQSLLTPGTTYTLKATAIYNGRMTNYTLPGTYTVPSPPSSVTNFFLQKFLGLPVWAWLAIAAAAVVGILVFLFVVRRQAAGKLVECGECGNLIPEDATVCPKCGAEFESDLIRCSRCASTIPAESKFCPECAAQLLGAPGEAESDPEKQAYADFTEKYRAEAKRELGDNYSEGAFWDWWKRQPTYTPFSQWSLQQGQGTARVGMTAPPAGTETTPEGEQPPAAGKPPKGGAGWTEGPAAAGAAPAPAAPAAAPPPTPPPAGGGLKACPNCGKEIPSEYLVCPFCNAVTQ